tara:strand:- start:5200 stop:6387 length:1188 start_codon:yes stop_codon:yes gene_type:complete
MGLSVFQSLAIAGGTAAETMSKIERDRKDKVLTALTKTIDDAKAPAGEYRQKHMLIKSKAEEDLKQIVNTYFPERDDLTQKQKVVAASALYRKHGYKLENLNKNYQSSLTFARNNNLATSDNYSRDMYLNSQFAKGALKNIEGQDLDTIVSIIAQNKLGQPPMTTESFTATADAYDTGKGFFTSPIDVKTMAANAQKSFGLPTTVDGTIETVALKPTYDAFQVEKDLQAYGKNTAQMENWKASNKNAQKINWKEYHKLASQGAITSSELGNKLKFDDNGVISVVIPGDKISQDLKQKVERSVLRNFVTSGIELNKIKDSSFLAYVQNVGANVVAVPPPLMKGKTEVTTDNIDYSRLIPGMTYEIAGKRIVFTGIKDKDNDFINIELMTPQPKQSP